jgi:hypothetical protein
MMRINLGCGKNIKPEYLNIDKYTQLEGVVNTDLFTMSVESSSVDEIIAEHVFEHVAFSEEAALFEECYRILKKSCELIIEVPDMEWLCNQFLSSHDDFFTFYINGSPDHYFGRGKSIEHRWGIITTHFFGNQNGPGQFHYNGYTKNKLISISNIVGFESCVVTKLMNKGAQCLRAVYTK